MGSISPFWVYLVQVLLVIHVLATGRSRYWIFLLIFVPLVGGLAYLVMEILPELAGGIRGQRARRGLNTLVNPGGHIKRLAAAWQQTPNADNARHYGGALLQAGRLEEAEAVIDTALSGLFSTEPNLLLVKARIRFELDDASGAVKVLESLQQANPEFRSADGHLLLARALEDAGDMSRSLEEYRSVASYYPGVEARYRYAMALDEAERTEEARRELEQILQDARLAPAHFRKAQAEWLRRTRSALN